MAAQGVNGAGVAAMAAGGLLLWSGIRGANVLTALRSVLSGSAPADTETTALVVPGGAGGTSAGAGGAVAPAGPGETAWITALLATVGALPTAANVSSLTRWIARETTWTDTPPDGALYTHNPLNTTEPGFGASGSVNSVGVKRYPTAAQGVGATAAALTNGRYGDILAALRAGRGLQGSFAGLSTWSGGGYSSV